VGNGMDAGRGGGFWRERRGGARETTGVTRVFYPGPNRRGPVPVYCSGSVGNRPEIG
jgi:hypothetical protein